MLTDSSKPSKPRSSAPGGNRVSRPRWVTRLEILRAHGAVGATSSSVVGRKSPPGEAAGEGQGIRPVRPRGPVAVAPARVSAGVQQKGPKEWARVGWPPREACLDDVPNGVSRILGSAGTTQPPIDEQLKQIEGQSP